MCDCICGWLAGDIINGEKQKKGAGCTGANAGQTGAKHCRRTANGCRR